MRIGELAERAHCTTETIRFYEKKKLLMPALRGENNYRYYDQTHLQRLKLIRNCRAFDMSIDEITLLLSLIVQPQEDCFAIRALLKEHEQHIKSRIVELSFLKQYLGKVIKQCDNSHRSDHCTIISELMSQDILPETLIPQTHLS